MKKVWPLLLAPSLVFLLTVRWFWTHKHMNRLAQESSPYLLQHASNPVNWQPWDEAAFAQARKEQKPIFLSVGYSTCHWCHVMEHESFEDAGIAEILNKNFIAIKVDREERPDVDRIYMTFVQATTGSGGWPMSVFLTPDLKPFMGGTYFPKEDRFGRPGFRSVLLRIADAWQHDRERVVQSAGEVIDSLQKMIHAGYEDSQSPDRAVLDTLFHRLAGNYDGRYGGFGRAPKFPRPSVYNFLLRYHARTGDQKALEMTLHTLRAMAAGGMHDHLGGGFHRYSVDPTWHVPHFEKMLYDQAQLAASYIEAYQIVHEPFYAETARDILDYVLRDMRSPEGGFYSAEDADSLFAHGQKEHGEGAFYIWSAGEIANLLGPDAAAFNAHYGVVANGNVPTEWDQQGEFRGRNILIERKDGDRAALAAPRKKLFDARAKRPRPGLDDKVLTAWNGLMISAFARASQALDAPEYLAAAEGAARLIKEKLCINKQLLRRYRKGQAAIPAFVDDYAFLIGGLLDLYETSFDVSWLAWAIELQESQDRLFWDAQAGGYYSTSGADPSILLRMREDYDGAEPSPNSIAAMNLLRLAQITDRKDWREKAEKTLSVFSGRMEQAPEALPQMAAAMEFHFSKPRQIVVAGAPGAPDTRELLAEVHRRFLPNKIVLLADGAAGQKQLGQWIPVVAGMSRKDGRATAYVCENYVCQLPTTDKSVVARLLNP